MGAIIAGFTMSLDGFIADQHDDIRPLFGWFSSGDTVFTVPNSQMVFHVSQASAHYLETLWGSVGAFVTGRRDFEVSRAWGGTPPYGWPAFILTHTPPAEWLTPGSPFTFVSGDVAGALAQARAAAGDRHVIVSGTTVVRQCLEAGLLDEIHIDLVSLLLGSGKRLFDHLEAAPVILERLGVVEGIGVTHLSFRVRRHVSTAGGR